MAQEKKVKKILFVKSFERAGKTEHRDAYQSWYLSNCSSRQECNGTYIYGELSSSNKLIALTKQSRKLQGGHTMLL
jgi:hypothetical protein